MGKLATINLCFYYEQFVNKRDESRQGQVVWGYGGRLRRCGNSKRSEVPPDGHRSDSPGNLYDFPVQRSSDSGLVTLRLSRPPALRNVKSFSHLRRCPPYPHTTCPCLLSVCWRREVGAFGASYIYSGCCGLERYCVCSSFSVTSISSCFRVPVSLRSLVPWRVILLVLNCLVIF